MRERRLGENSVLSSEELELIGGATKLTRTPFLETSLSAYNPQLCVAAGSLNMVGAARPAPVELPSSPRAYIMTTSRGPMRAAFAMSLCRNSERSAQL